MGYFKRILNNCSETSLYSEKEIFRQASLKKKAEVLFHIAFCKCCKNFVEQSGKMDKSLHYYFDHLNENPPYQLEESIKEELKQKMKDAE